jgi:hypothetical protein
MSHASSSTSRTGCCGGASTAAVRAGNVASSASKKSRCSCGGGCSCGGSGSCGCGGACQNQDFVRPRFFAGQLLTEDDLDLLGGYVVEKNRLHNRSFFGEGVVCGLMVTCDPCGDGKVSVQPGYALDCCGNDIVVPCAQTLDVNALVRRLRIERTGGVDCGDPCADQKSRTAASDTANTDGEQGQTVPPLPPAEYCLYVRYCEQNSDPVSPYATDDPCGVQACEPTRVREGFTFELRCRDCDEDAPDNLFAQIAHCLGNLVTTEQTARNTRSALLYNSALSPALSRLAVREPAPLLVGPDRLEAVKQARLRVDALPDRAESWTAVNMYDAADAAQTMASLVAAWSAIPAAKQRSVENAEEIRTQVKNAQDGLSRIAKAVPRDRVASLIDDPFDRDVVAATTDRAVLWANPNEAMKVVPAGERELLSGGIVYSKQMRSSIASTLARMKATLNDRIRNRRFATDCTLLRDLNAIVIPDDDPAGASNAASALEVRNAIEQLIDVYVRYLRECICSAINPPCPSCDDPAVLLACLRVEGCDVRDICNLERTFVLTPVAIRYWLPFLRSFGNVLERLCCPENRCDPPSRRTRAAVIETPAPVLQPLSRAYVEQRSALNVADRFIGPGRTFDPAHIAAVLPARLAFSPDNARRLATSTAAVLDVVSLRGGVPPGDLLSMLITPITVPSTGGPSGPVPPPPAVADVGAMRRDIDDLRARLKAADERNKGLDARLKKLGG